MVVQQIGKNGLVEKGALVLSNDSSRALEKVVLLFVSRVFVSGQLLYKLIKNTLLRVLLS